jgi:hypothetical protein
MSEPNDRAFEDYLEGKSAVSARYRELSTDDVPPEIDAAVMARARAAIASRASNSSRLPKMSAWRRWRAPLAVAASAVLVVSILLNAGPEQKVGLQPQRDVASTVERRADVVAPAPSAVAETRAEQVAVPAFSPEELSSVSAAEDIVGASRTQSASADVVAGAPAIAQSVPSSEPQLEAPMRVAEARAREAAAATRAAAEQKRQMSADAAVRRTAPAAVAEQIAVPSAAVPQLLPEAWLERIRALRRDGMAAEADEQWRAFVKAYPDYHVGATDLARPENEREDPRERPPE